MTRTMLKALLSLLATAAEAALVGAVKTAAVRHRSGGVRAVGPVGVTQ